MGNFFLAHNVGQAEFLTGIERAWNNVGNRQDVFVEKTTALRYHPAFVSTGIEVFFDVVDVPDDVVLVDGLRGLVVVIGKDITHLGGVIAHRAR